MALKDIKARLAAQIQAADPPAKVYTFRRVLMTEEQQKLLIGTDGRVHAWFVSREMTALTDLVVDQGFVQQDDTLVLEGLLGVKDADDTEEMFDAILDAVLQAVNKDREPVNSGGTKLGGFAQTSTTPSLRKYDFVEYGPSKVLCHHAEIVMKVTPRYLQ